jgi:hypothetical protein
MLWHIFRKDWRLLWPIAAASAALQGLLAVGAFHSQPYPLSDGVSALSALVTLGLLVTLCLSILLCVQQEVIPSVSEDWLVRPIRRRDVLLAKLLWIVVCVHGPIVVANTVSAVAEGFPASEALQLTLLGNLKIALVFSLPAMAVAALTRSVGEALLGAVAVFAGLIVLWLAVRVCLYALTGRFEFFGPTGDTGIEWVWATCSDVILLAAVCGVLALQYFRRETLRARAWFVTGLFLYIAVQSLPWQPAFAIQQALSGDPGAGRAISLHSMPRSSPGTLLSQSSRSSGTQTTVVELPITVSGLPPGALLHVDRCVVRLIGRSGEILYTGLAVPTNYRSKALDGSTTPVYQPMQLPTSVYRRVSEQVTRVELDYSLTLLSARTMQSLPVLQDARYVTGFGRCASRTDAGATALEVGCRKVGEYPSCMSISLERSGHNDLESLLCTPRYEPAALHFDVDPVDAVHTRLEVHEMRDARIVLRSYQPDSHFARHMTLP